MPSDAFRLALVAVRVTAMYRSTTFYDRSQPHDHISRFPAFGHTFRPTVTRQQGRKAMGYKTTSISYDCRMTAEIANMDHYPQHSRRTYMDDRVYRSAPNSSLGYNRMLVDPRTPRYSPSLYDDSLRTGYFDPALEDDRSRHARSPYERGFYGYEPETQWGSDELVRRCVIAVTSPQRNVH